MTALTAGRTARLDATATSRARWNRPALGALLACTAVLYLVGLSRNGWANDFYAAAVQAGAKSWKAFFFGSFDSSNFITVDKTPGSLWAMELSVRLFGLNYWSVLVPQALEGVASVALLYAAVRRWFGPGAGLLAGAVLALTPVATLMFRFNNPDAMLVLVMTAAAYGVVRAIESGRTRWLVLAGGLLGFGFLTKMLQAFLVLPAFGLVYLIAGPPGLGRRIWQLLAGLAALVVAAGWWVAAVMLTPAADRPYVGGSTNDSILQLAFGYNGLGRLDGNETGSVGFSGGHGGSPFGGSTGVGRLFADEMGGQISWLLPAALLAIGALTWLAWRGSRRGRPGRALAGPGAPAASDGGAATATIAGVVVGSAADHETAPGLIGASALLWGGWLVVTGATFSFMAGIIHPYYTVALAPAIGALVGIGAVLLWRQRDGWAARALLAAGVALTAGWSYTLLERSSSWYPWLRFAVVIIGFAAAALLLLPPRLTGKRAGPAAGRGGGLTLAGVAAAAAAVAALAGPAAYSLDTVATAHTGALPTAGPAVTDSFGGPGGAGRFGGAHGFGGRAGLPGRSGRPGSSGGFGSGTGGRPSGFGGSGSGSGSSGLGSGSAPSGFGSGSAPSGSGSGSAPSGFGSGSAPSRFGSGSAPSGFGSGSAPSGFGSGSASSGPRSRTGGIPGSGSRSGLGHTGRSGSPGGARGGFGGGLGGSTQVSAALTRLLKTDASAYTWAAATVGSESAAPLQLATDDPIMSIGGFNGTDPAPTLAAFEKLVAEHKIHYFVGANSDSFGGGSGDAKAISTWVAAHFTARTVGGETTYNLTQPTSGG